MIQEKGTFSPVQFYNKKEPAGILDENQMIWSKCKISLQNGQILCIHDALVASKRGR